MKTPTQLRRVIEAAGAVMEEDEGTRDMRTFQAVAPDGMIWQEGCVCLRVEWFRGTSRLAEMFNEAEYKSLAERVSFGLREQTPEERELTATD